MNPGWYGDPYQRHEVRYWNGSEWTDQVSDAGRQSQDPPGDTAATAPTTGSAQRSEERGDAGKKAALWAWRILLVAIMVIPLLGIAALFGSVTATYDISKGTVDSDSGYFDAKWSCGSPLFPHSATPKDDRAAGADSGVNLGIPARGPGLCDDAIRSRRIEAAIAILIGIAFWAYVGFRKVKHRSSARDVLSGLWSPNKLTPPQVASTSGDATRVGPDQPDI